MKSKISIFKRLSLRMSQLLHLERVCHLLRANNLDPMKQKMLYLIPGIYALSVLIALVLPLIFHRDGLVGIFAIMLTMPWSVQLFTIIGEISPSLEGRLVFFAVTTFSGLLNSAILYGVGLGVTLLIHAHKRSLDSKR